MSTDQVTLADAVETAATDEDPQGETNTAARDAAATPLWSRADENQCQNCGYQLTTREARVLGDNDGCVPQCAHCSQWETLATAVHAERVGYGGDPR